MLIKAVQLLVCFYLIASLTAGMGGVVWIASRVVEAGVNRDDVFILVMGRLAPWVLLPPMMYALYKITKKMFNLKDGL